MRMLERNIAEATSLLRGIQLALVALAVVGATALIYLSFLFIIRPVHQLEDGLAADGARRSQRPAHRRVATTSSGRWRPASITWPAKLEESYRTLESRVAEKTASLAQQNRRLSTLYDMTAFLNAPDSTEELCRGFLRRVMGATGAAGGAVRLGRAKPGRRCTCSSASSCPRRSSSASNALRETNALAARPRCATARSCTCWAASACRCP